MLANEAWAKGPLGALAKHGLENLENPEYTKFLDQFASYEPRPRATGPGAAGERPPKTVPEPNSPAEFSSLMNLGGGVKAGGKQPAKPEPAKSGSSKPETTKAAKVETPKAEAPKAPRAKTDSGKAPAAKG